MIVLVTTFVIVLHTYVVYLVGFRSGQKHGKSRQRSQAKAA